LIGKTKTKMSKEEVMKEFRKWWVKDGTGVPVWFLTLTMVVIFVIGTILLIKK
jgi:hypothetical protein